MVLFMVSVVMILQRIFDQFLCLNYRYKTQPKRKTQFPFIPFNPGDVLVFVLMRKNDAGTRKLSGLPAGEVLLRERAKKIKK
jgi:hypothetical protein